MKNLSAMQEFNNCMEYLNKKSSECNDVCMRLLHTKGKQVSNDHFKENFKIAFDDVIYLVNESKNCDKVKKWLYTMYNEYL